MCVNPSYPADRAYALKLLNTGNALETLVFVQVAIIYVHIYQRIN